MSISRLRWRLALALGTAAAAALTLAVPAGASTGTAQTTREQAGYSATNARFKAIHAGVYLRNPGHYAGMVASYRHSVQLWSSGLVVTVGVRASTSGTSYTPYATIYDRATHQVIASNPNAHNRRGEITYPGVGPPVPFGKTERLKIFYDRATGLQMLAESVPPGSFDEDSSVSFTYTVSPQSFTQARVGTEFGSSPWDSSYSYTPPAARVKVAAYGVDLWTYNNHWSGLWSWWVHHKLLAQPPGSDLVAVPHNLYNGGHSFQTWLVP